MKKLILILVTATTIRLIGINQSLWLDEAISAKVITQYSYSQIVNVFSPHDFHPPLFYLTLKLWSQLAGTSEVGMRLLSVLFSLITIVLIYKLAGWEPAALTAFNPLLLYYSQEARMYSMVTMIVTAALFCLIKKKYVGYTIFAGLGFLTFYGSAFVMLSVSLYFLYKRQIKLFLITSTGPLAAMLLVLPLLRQQLVNSQEMLSQVQGWSLVLGKANLKNLILIPMKFCSGRISFYPKIVYYLVAGSWMVITMAVAIFNKSKNKLVAYFFWSTLTIGVVFSLFTPMLQYFRFLYLVPLMCLLINRNKLILFGFTAFSLAYVLNPQMYRENWKDLATNAGQKVYMINSVSDPVKYYNPKIEVVDITVSKPIEKEIMVIPYAEDIHGFSHSEYLNKLGYKLNRATDYRQVTLEEWVKRL
jgi:uncharacterized membrane protein